MIGDGDDGYVLDLGDARRCRALFCVGAGLFGRADFKAWARRVRRSARWLLGASGRAAFDALPPAPAGERLASRALPDSGYYLLQCGHTGRRSTASAWSSTAESWASSRSRPTATRMR